jgi:hypothetical protein
VNRRIGLSLLVLISLPLFLTSCGGEVVFTPAPPAIVVRLSAATVQALQDGTPASVDVTVTRPAGTSASVTVSAFPLPNGVTAQIDSPGTGNTGKVTFQAAAQSGTAGTYRVTIRASDGTSSGSAELSLVVAVVATVASSSGRRLEMFMSTSFQPASWTDQFFIQYPDATVPLDNLQAQHANMQALERDIPQTTADTWNFTYLDGMVNPILSTSDHSPLFQIARGPDFMYDDAALQHFRDGTYQEFAEYAANLVEYYNRGGFFDTNGQYHVSSAYWPISYWGIYNEPNINGLTAAEYVKLYNVVVPAMLAADPTLKFVAVELADFSTEPQRYLPTFVSNVRAQVDVVATHYYSTCNQADTDQTLFNTIPGFVDHIDYIYTELRSNPALANVPVWVTENNVNADWSNGGFSNCNPGTPFVADPRGSSAFFAAWRPYVFSRFAQADVRALHHWEYNGDVQYGEANGATGSLQLSYWVDYWLGQYLGYREDTSTGASLLDLSVTDSDTVEVLAAQRDADGAVIVMVANHAVQAANDNNGAGAPRTVVVDLSAWTPFTSASLLTIDANTDPATGPSPQSITPSSRMEITLGGYGVSFLELK